MIFKYSFLILFVLLISSCSNDKDDSLSLKDDESKTEFINDVPPPTILEPDTFMSDLAEGLVDSQFTSGTSGIDGAQLTESTMRCYSQNIIASTPEDVLKDAGVTVENIGERAPQFINAIDRDIRTTWLTICYSSKDVLRHYDIISSLPEEKLVCQINKVGLSESRVAITEKDIDFQTQLLIDAADCEV